MNRKAERPQEEDQDRSGREKHASATSPWEWALGVVGLVLVLGVIGYIAYHGLTAEAGPPSIEIQATAVDRTPGGYVVRFSARNLNGVTAAALRIRGELRRGQSVVERSEVVLDYLPAFSERKGGLIFQEGPAGYDLRIAPEAYAEP